MFAINIENLKTLKYHILLKKTLGLSIACSKCVHKYKKIFKKESVEILKILGLITNIKEHQEIHNHD